LVRARSGSRRRDRRRHEMTGRRARR
jgi:hypothetical protein